MIDANKSTEQRNDFETNVAILREIVQFAYEQGFHELGYNIVDELLAQIDDGETIPVGPRLTDEELGELAASLLRSPVDVKGDV